MTFLSIKKKRKKKKKKDSADSSSNTATKSQGKKKRRKKKDNDDSDSLNLLNQPDNSVVSKNTKRKASSDLSDLNNRKRRKSSDSSLSQEDNNSVRAKLFRSKSLDLSKPEDSNIPRNLKRSKSLDSLNPEDINVDNNDQDLEESSDSSDTSENDITRRKPKRRQSSDSSNQDSDNETLTNQPQSVLNSIEEEINNLNWSSDVAASLISKRAVEGGKPQRDLSLQNEANAIVWFNTLFKQNDNEDTKNPLQDKILQDQQNYLKRHFLAMASLGIQGGNQNDASTYKPLEEFTTNNGNQVNLATVSSGGGRFNYRSEDGSGNKFNNFLLYDSDKGIETKNIILSKGKNLFPQSYKNTPPTSYLGAFERVSTHNETFDTQSGTIKEASNKKGLPAIGFDIPIGGVGQKLINNKGKEVITGYQGRTTDGESQTGTVLQRHAEQGNLTSTLVAFEGSGPGQNNIYGGSHGALATVGKVLGITKSTHTLTGQGKRSTWGLKHEDGQIGGITGNGGLKADITDGKLKTLKDQWKQVKNMDSETQEDFYKRLLLTKTQQERTALFNRFRLPTTSTSQPPNNQSNSDTNNFVDSVY